MKRTYVGEVRFLTFFTALGERDQVEGDAGLETLGTFTSRDLAEGEAKGRGLKGSDGYVRERTYAIIGDEAFELGQKITPEEVQTLEMKVVALGKLTQEERRLLGWSYGPLPVYSKE